MIEVSIHVPDARAPGGVGDLLEASAGSAGYTVKAWCSGWGRNRDGSIRLDLRATVTSPPGLVEVLP